MSSKTNRKFSSQIGKAVCFLKGCELHDTPHPLRIYFNMNFGDLPHWWRSATGKNPPEDARICELHFEERFIDRARKIPRLLVGTIPTLNLPSLEETSGDFDQNDMVEVIDDLNQYICRFCATKYESPLETTLNELIDTMQEVVNSCLGKYVSHTILPEKICEECVTKITIFDSFIKQCAESQQQLLADEESFTMNEKENTESLKEHGYSTIVTDQEEVVYSCSECSETFPNLGNYYSHVRSHTEESDRAHDCEICGQNFETVEMLSSHLVTSHGGQTIAVGTTITATVVDETLRKQSPQTSHCRWKVKRQHPVASPDKILNATVLKCTQCSEKFPSPEKLKQHLAKHQDTKERFDCNFCGRIFKYKSHLQLHSKRAHKYDSIALKPGREREGASVRRPIMTKQCCVPGCEATSLDFATFLFGFPEAKDQQRQWLEVLGCAYEPTDDKNFVCWSHFQDGDIQRDNSGGVSFSRKNTAVPCRFLGPAGVATSRKELNQQVRCRLCAKVLEKQMLGNDLNEMNRSQDSKYLMEMLTVDGTGIFSTVACDECFGFVQLMMRFIRNCRKATEQLNKLKERCLSVSDDGMKTEIKEEFEEYGAISVEPVIKVEDNVLTSDVESDRDDEILPDNDSDDEDDDDIPLARQFENRQKTVETDYKCKHCSFVCKSEIQLNHHTKRHSTSKNILTCTECSYTCDTVRQLGSHLKKHKSEKKNTLASKKGNHEQQQDNQGKGNDAKEEVTDTKLNCPECPYVCKKANQLASHKKKHLNRKKSKESESKKGYTMVDNLFQCEFCEFTCENSRQMAGHRASHSDKIKSSKPSGKERDHMCSICGKILSTRGSFFVHMKYHNDQKDFCCKICDKKFYTKREMTMHMDSVHEKKIFKCEICGVECRWQNALYKHMRKHDQNSFKHECGYCGKRFIAPNELRLHVWRHTGQQVTCDICGAGYRFNFLLTQHKIRVHGIQVEGVKLYKRFQKEKSSGSAKSPKGKSKGSTASFCVESTAEQNHHQQGEASNSSYSSTEQSGSGVSVDYPHNLTLHSQQLNIANSQQQQLGSLPIVASSIPLSFNQLSGAPASQQLPPADLTVAPTNLFAQVEHY
ncbi:zinc finger protein Xfin-like [Uranotaenia lowii]|uniref:zinc finger protein Xfin-like n=1 Tax=Uranotaenia lowii TaxID=190385 RepID=UPI00247B02C7|nr:zinc finger protein Xfin-like [Uranotaenia lowii]